MRAEALQNDGFNAAVPQLVPLIDESDCLSIRSRQSRRRVFEYIKPISARKRFEIESWGNPTYADVKGRSFRPKVRDSREKFHATIPLSSRFILLNNYISLIFFPDNKYL